MSSSFKECRVCFSGVDLKPYCEMLLNEVLLRDDQDFLNSVCDIGIIITACYNTKFWNEVDVMIMKLTLLLPKSLWS